MMEKTKMRNFGRKVIICFLLIVMFSPSLIFPQDTNLSSDVWLERAQRLTDDIINDATSIHTPDRAVIYARLGNLWWRDDPARARAWVVRAIEAVESTSIQESNDERNRRLAAARDLLRIVAPLDRDLSVRLSASFTLNGGSVTGRETMQNADAMVDAALAVLETDPRRAAQLGEASLRTGHASRIALLLARLARRDRALGAQLFDRALISARTNYDPYMLTDMSNMVFNGPLNLQTHQRAMLNTLAEIFLRPPASPNEARASCQLINAVMPLMSQFNSMLPQQAAAIRAQVRRCQPLVNQTSAQLANEIQRERPLETVEDFLQAAETTDGGARLRYTARALEMLDGRGEHERAIAVLDAMSSEDQRSLSWNGWERWRIQYTIEAVKAHLRRRDLAEANRIINAAPSRLRANVQLGVASDLTDMSDNTLSSLTREFLEAARASMLRGDLMFPVNSYLLLVRHYATHLPADAPSVLVEAVTAINRATQNARTQYVGDEPLLHIDPLALSLPAAVFDADETSINTSLATITSPNIRARIRLGLLNTVLRQRNERVTNISL
jgi:hypothetical protein